MLAHKEDPSYGKYLFWADPRWNRNKGKPEGRYDWANASFPNNHPVFVKSRKQLTGLDDPTILHEENDETMSSISATTFL